jgi:hypothetical protein
MRDDRLRAASADRGAKSPQILVAGDPAGGASLLNEVNASLLTAGYASDRRKYSACHQWRFVVIHRIVT